MRPKKVLPYKTYNSIGHLSGSRLGPTDSKIDMNTEKKMTEQFPLHHSCILFIEEKMDGSNVCVVRYEGELVCLSRSGYNCKDSNQEQHRMFYRWVMNHKEQFEELLPTNHDRVVGEWLALAHGTIYKELSSPFMAFDLYKNGIHQSLCNRKDEIDKVHLYNVPIILQSENPIPIRIALEYANMKNSNGEGVVYRMEKRKRNKKDNTFYYEPWMIAKVVKQDKEDGKFLKDGQRIWNWTD